MTPHRCAPTDVWSRLPEGPQLLKADERARIANEYRPESIPPIVDDPTSALVLPQLGYRLEATTYPNWVDGPRRSHTWKRHHSVNAFVLQLHTHLATHITSDGLADGTVRQYLRTEDAVAAWHAHRTALFGAAPVARARYTTPDEHDLPAHLALAIEQLPGGDWMVTDVGLERILPPWPLRYAPKPQPLKLELKTGLLADCIGWAYLPANSPDNDSPMHELVYLSGVGPQKKLKAAWATVMDRKRTTIKVPLPVSGSRFDMIATRRMEGSSVYDAYWNDDPLAESGMAHLVIQHRSLLRPRIAQPFLHLVGADGTPHLSQFSWQLDQASTLPIKSSWAARLWDDGLSSGTIVMLPSYGCQAYWVRPDDTTWSELIARCAGATGPISIETFGLDTDTSPAVAIVVSESDDEPETTSPETT